MKIAIDAAFGKKEPAGLELWGMQFIRHLAEFDRVNEYIIYGYFWRNFHQRKKMVYVPEEKKISLCVSRIPKQCVDFMESHNIGIIEKLLAGQQIDIFHGIGFFLPKLKKAKGIITVHGLDFKELEVKWYKDRWYKHFPVYLKRADSIIAVSEYVKNKLVELYDIPREKISVIYHGIRSNFAYPGFDNIENGVNEKSYIVCVATSVERKNLKRILKAFNTIKDRHKDVNLLMVGDERMLLSSLKKLIEELDLSGRIIFPGYLGEDSLPVVYNNAKCLVFPSLYEGLGLPIIEAMACGCPVITSNITAMPEIAGGAAILVNPYDEDEIADAVDRVLSDERLRQDMKKKGLERAKFFSWEKAINNTLDLYNRLSERN
ncbi:MAG TPA: glycosyltransferase family 1 protein [bacterium]|nr:glycosyltransferase family 1 protein [bacterium]